MLKRFLSLFVALLLACGSMTYTAYADTVEDNVSGAPEVFDKDLENKLHPDDYFTDEAGLISKSEARNLNETLKKLSEELKFDIVIVTTGDLGGKTAMQYCDDWYDYNHYGVDEENSGICLLRYMKPDHSDYEVWISTTGQAIWMFGDYEIDQQIDLIADDIIDERYYSAFTSFAKNVYNYVLECREYQSSLENQGSGSDVLINYNDHYGDYDHYYDYHPRYTPKTPQQIVGICLLISAVVGLIFAFVMTMIYKGQLKSVAKATSANLYVKKETFRLTQNQDIFLYKNVTKTAIPKDTGSSGGHSSTHSGSSGVSHGGGGRHI